MSRTSNIGNELDRDVRSNRNRSSRGSGNWKWARMSERARHIGKKENHPRIDKKAKFARKDGAREATLSCRAARTPEWDYAAFCVQSLKRCKNEPPTELQLILGVG